MFDHPFTLLETISSCHIVLLEKHVNLVVLQFFIIKCMHCIFKNSHRTTLEILKSKFITMIPNSPCNSNNLLNRMEG